MNQVEAIFESLKRANPAPDPDELQKPAESEVLQWMRAEERMIEVTLDLETKPSEHQQLRTRPVWIGAVASLTIGIALVLALANRTSEIPPADRSPMETATEFMTAMSRLDVEATTALFDENIQLVGIAKDWEGLIEWHRASDWVHTPGRCSELTSLFEEENTVTIFCNYLPANAWSEALGHEVTIPDRFVLTIHDGRIVKLDNRWTPGYTSSFLPVWTAFIEWVEQTHPEDLEVMFDDDGIFDLGEESIAAWARNTDEFVSSHSG